MDTTYKTEFHVHTKYSHDSGMGKWALYFIGKLRGINCFAITDHNEISGAVKYRPWLEKKGIQVIVGEEIFSNEGEIIGLFLEKKIEPGLSPEETIREIKKQNGIVYLPHPYDEKRHRTVLSNDALKQCAEHIDCAEFYNGRNIKSAFGIKQKEIVDTFGFVPIVGGDSHVFFEIGRNVCLVEEKLTRENFFEVISKAQFNQKPCLKVAHQITRLVRTGKYITRGDFDGLRRALNRKLTRRK